MPAPADQFAGPFEDPVTPESNRAHADDALPYDRELIRSGGVTEGRQRGGERPRRGRPRRAASRELPPSRRGLVGNVILLLLAAVVAGGLLIGVRAAAFNGAVSTAPFVSSALFAPLNGDDRVNVLLVGYGGGDHGGAYLADSIQVLSIDPETQLTTTIPIPRDLWIEGVPAYAQAGKVNEVFAAGHARDGPAGAGDVLARVLTEVTGLTIDHWMSIDFAGFRDMVDAVGGVTIDNPTPFCWTTIEEFHRAGRWEMGCFDAGRIRLDGEQALMYSRARYTSVVSESNDFARSARQARVLAALRAELGGGGLGALGSGLSLMDAMEGNVHTDLSAVDLFLLSSHIASDRRVELTEGPVLTASTTNAGQYILLPTGWVGPGDYQRLQAHLERELAAPSDAP